MNKIKQFIYNHSFGISLLPFYLGLNITNRCNRQCVFCPYHSPFLEKAKRIDWVKSKTNDLDLEKFAKFLKRLGIFRKMIKHIALTGRGEPMLHTNFHIFCILINDYKIKFSITTNGDYLDEEYINLLIRLKYLKVIRVSIYDPQKVQHWLYLKDKYPKLFLYNMTGQEIEGIEIGFRTWSPGLDEICSKDLNKKTFCSIPFSFITMEIDGLIVPCYSYNEIATINDSIWTIYNGRKIREYRKAALKMQAKHTDCKNCGAHLK